MVTTPSRPACRLGGQLNRFSDDVEVLVVEPQTVLYHTRTGRRIQLSPDSIRDIEEWDPRLLPPPNLTPLANRLAQLHMLQENPPPDYLHLIPVQSNLVLLLPDENALWYPNPNRLSTHGYRYQSLRLTENQVRIWRACNGNRSIDEVATINGQTTREILEFIWILTNKNIQCIQLRNNAVRSRDMSKQQLIPLAASAPLQIAETDTASVAQAFSHPHPSLNHEAYGSRLLETLAHRNCLPDEGDTLIISDGYQSIQSAWIRSSLRLGRPIGEVICLEVEPRKAPDTDWVRLPGVRRIEASASAIPLQRESLSLVICSEVMSGLSAVPFDATTSANPSLSQGLAPAVAQAIDQYQLNPLPGRAWYNLGAWQLIEQLARLLKPGGFAVLIDQGEVDQAPQPSEKHSHTEVSIHFGHLTQIARALGFDSRVIPLVEFLDFQTQSHWLSQHSYRALQSRLQAEGKRLRPYAWTPENLSLPWAVEGLHWVPISQPGPGPLVTRHQAMVLRRT